MRLFDGLTMGQIAKYDFLTIFVSILFVSPFVLVTSAQTNPYAPEIDVNCYYYNNYPEEGVLFVRPDGYYYTEEEFICAFYNQNTIDLTVEISWTWDLELSIEPPLSNGDSIVVLGNSQVDYYFDVSGDKYTSPEEYEFVLTSLVTHYGNGLIPCDSCESQQENLIITVYPWATLWDIELTKNDMFDGCDENLIDEKDTLSVNISFSGNSDEIEIISALSIAASYLNVNDSHGESEGSSSTITMQNDVKKIHTMQIDLAFSLDLDEIRTDDTEITVWWDYSIYPTAGINCDIAYVLSKCDGGYYWDRIECTLDKNAEKSEDGTIIQPEDDYFLKIPNISSLLTIIVVLISGIFYRQTDIERFC